MEDHSKEWYESLTIVLNSSAVIASISGFGLESITNSELPFMPDVRWAVIGVCVLNIILRIYSSKRIRGIGNGRRAN